MKYFGTLKYNANKTWLTLECDPEIGRYYRYIHNNYYYNCRLIRQPSWKEHVTVIRDESINLNQNFWSFNNNSKVEFDLDLVIKDNGDFVWMDVNCDELFKLREFFGLPRHPEYPFHLTIGNLV